jgi:hypothetical protein
MLVNNFMDYACRAFKLANAGCHTLRPKYLVAKLLGLLKNPGYRHCEERSDEAIS